MVELKTTATAVNPTAFIAAVDDPVKRAEAAELDALFRRVTGWEPRMWGPSLIGYGRYSYTYDTGRTGEFLATGFSPRKAEHSIYILPGYADFDAILSRLGKHKIGKSCLYIKRLPDIDMTVLEDLIRAGLTDLAAKHPVFPA